MAKYIKTIQVQNPEALKELQVGQWFKFHDGVRGQWMGSTASDVFVNRFQDGKFTKKDALDNAKIRKYAKRYSV